MLRTIILDAYREAEKQSIVDALEMLCSPTDNYGWASAGIYAYWNYETKEILYVGLAVDLTERFRQHNGFYPSMDPNGCKRDFIDQYFRTHDKIGFSTVVQSPLSQPAIREVQTKFDSLFTRVPLAMEIGQEGLSEIQRLEGVLLEAFKRLNSKLPDWNRIGGSTKGQKAVRPANNEALKVLANRQPHQLLAHSTLREIAANSTFERYENFLHAIRMQAPMIGWDNATKATVNQDIIGTYGHILQCGYLDKVPSL